MTDRSTSSNPIERGVSASTLATEAGEPTVQDLKARVKKGGFLVTGGYATGQALRLASNLILTRLLAPDIFGIVALVQAFLSGLEMFSDAGIGLSIVQSKSGANQRFLNTAWTMQILRGLLIASLACLISPFVGRLYDEPALPILLIVSSFGPLTKSFAATGMFTASRDVQLGRLTVVELCAQVLGLTTALLWARVDASAWALVAAAIVSSSAIAIGSHVFLPKRRHRFAWDRDAVSELFRFGMWIFIGSVFGFIANHADRLIVGKLFSMAELGMYSIATMLVRFIVLLYQKFSGSLLLPVYSSAVREGRGELPRLVRKARLKVFPFFILPLVALAATGDMVVDFLFDDRYLGAGFMLQLLSVAWLVQMSWEVGPVMLAHGNSRLATGIISAQSLLQVACMLVGGLTWGATGLLGGLIAARFLAYPLKSFANNKFGAWFPTLDVAMLGVAGLLGWGLYQLRPYLLPLVAEF